MALTAAAYLVPGAWQRPVAVAAVVVLVGVNLLGVTRTARVGAVIVAVVLAVLVVVVVAGIRGSRHGPARRRRSSSRDRRPPTRCRRSPAAPTACCSRPRCMFFAFAGYARIATLGEEVRDPRAPSRGRSASRSRHRRRRLRAPSALPPWRRSGRNCSRHRTLRSSTWSRLRAGAGPSRSCGSPPASPRSARCSRSSPGIARTELAMARDRELPARLAAVHPRFARRRTSPSS